jgi:hypothetical protein
MGTWVGPEYLSIKLYLRELKLCLVLCQLRVQNSFIRFSKKPLLPSPLSHCQSNLRKEQLQEEAYKITNRTIEK